MEFIKDPNEPCGWTRQTYENGGTLDGVGALPAEPMDEGAAHEGGGEA